MVGNNHSITVIFKSDLYMIPPVTDFNTEDIRQIEGVFFDIDDTFSAYGKIYPEAYQALWDLKKAGYKLVPITGRPAGWCDFIARMWPVDAVVGENGAFYYRVDEEQDKFIKRYIDDDDVRDDKRKKLLAIRDEILSTVPGTALASDQHYREADLAIDFCEDVPRLGWGSIDKISEIFTKHGATSKVSSIHVNGWFGDYSKLGMTKKLAAELWQIDLEKEKSKFVYLGDSPNDEPMFKFFPFSIGVNNVLNFVEKMSHFPAFVTSKEGSFGFAEAAEIIIQKAG